MTLSSLGIVNCDIVILLMYLYVSLHLDQKNSAEKILKYFSYFFKETEFDITCKLHEISNPVFWEKYKKYHQVLAELAQRVVKVKILFIINL